MKISLWARRSSAHRPRPHVAEDAGVAKDIDGAKGIGGAKDIDVAEDTGGAKDIDGAKEAQLPEVVCEGADFSSQDGEVRPQRRTIAVAVARQIGGCNTTCSD